MKKTTKIAAALLAIAALLFSFAACAGKTDGKEPTDSANATDAAQPGSLMAELFTRVTADKDYTEWKNSFTATTFDEKQDGDTITFSIRGEEGLNGDYTFTLDGDYIVTESAEDDYTGYTLMMDLKSALAEHYGMSSMLMSGYLAASAFNDFENKYFITESADGKTKMKLYAAGAWDMSALDDVYVDDKFLENYSSTDEESFNLHVNCGKVMLTAFKDEDRLTVIAGEYGENTALTQKSILTLVNKVQPKGYEAFTAAFTELKDAEGEGYTVTMGVPEALTAEGSYPNEEGYSYVTVVFGSAAEETAE